MSKIVEKYSDGRPKTIKIDTRNTVYPEVGKGSVQRKQSLEDKAKFDAGYKAVFGDKQAIKNSQEMIGELKAFRDSL